MNQRRLVSELRVLIENACLEHPNYKTLAEMGSWRSIMANVASAFLDVKEKTGKNDGYLIELIQKTVDNKAQGEPYCMAFVQTIIAYTEYAMNLKSHLLATESVMQFYESADKSKDVIKLYPRPGYVACWQHRGARRGHAGIVYEVGEGWFTCVEGNSRSGSLEFGKTVEGEGIFLKRRTTKSVGTMDFLGYVAPFRD